MHGQQGTSNPETRGAALSRDPGELESGRSGAGSVLRHGHDRRGGEETAATLDRDRARGHVRGAWHGSASKTWRTAYSPRARLSFHPAASGRECRLAASWRPACSNPNQILYFGGKDAIRAQNPRRRRHRARRRGGIDPPGGEQDHERALQWLGALVLRGRTRANVARSTICGKPICGCQTTA